MLIGISNAVSQLDRAEKMVPTNIARVNERNYLYRSVCIRRRIRRGQAVSRMGQANMARNCRKRSVEVDGHRKSDAYLVVREVGQRCKCEISSRTKTEGKCQSIRGIDLE